MNATTIQTSNDRLAYTFLPYIAALCLNEKDIAIVVAFFRRLIARLTVVHSFQTPAQGEICPLSLRPLDTAMPQLDFDPLETVDLSAAMATLDAGETAEIIASVDTYAIAPIVAPAARPVPTFSYALSTVPSLVTAFRNAPDAKPTAQSSNGVTESEAKTTTTTTQPLYIRTPSGKYLPVTSEMTTTGRTLYRKDGRVYRKVAPTVSRSKSDNSDAA